MPLTIQLNADVGEGFGAWTMGDDAALFELITAANIACGFHAGDPLIMRRTVRLAIARGISIGAHPSFADLQGFGRRRMTLPNEEVEALIIYQIGALQAIAQAEGGRVMHVKPHGALNNMACEDPALAAVVIRAIQAVDRNLILLAPARSLLALAGQAAGLPVIEEIFADRRYLDDGNLIPRSRADACITDPDESARHVVNMLTAGGLRTISGQTLPCAIGSVCIHGDNPHALASARAVRKALLTAGYALNGN